MAIVLALVTGFVVSETGTLLANPSIDVEADKRRMVTAQVVRTFYDGANLALATGETGELGKVLDDDLVDHAPKPGVAGTRDGFLRSLESMHATVPTIQLTASGLVVQADRAMSTVTIAGGESASFLGFDISQQRLWGSVDSFRIADGRIVEHWGDQSGLVFFDPLVSTRVAVEKPTRKIVALERWMFEPDAVEQRLTDGGFLVMLAESGTLTVKIDRRSLSGGQMLRIGYEESIVEGAIEPERILKLRTGDSLTIPEGKRFEIRNDGKESAEALVVVTLAPSTLIAGDDPGVIPDAIGTHHEILAGGLAVSLPNGPAAVSIGRVGLGKDARLDSLESTDLRLVWVAAGDAAISTVGGDAWITTGPGDGTRNTNYARLGTGSGALFEAGSAIGFHIEGIAPTELVIVTIGAAKSG